MQIRNSKLCDSSAGRLYSAVNHPLWVSMLFHPRGWLSLSSAARYTCMDGWQLCVEATTSPSISYSPDGRGPVFHIESRVKDMEIFLSQNIPDFF